MPHKPQHAAVSIPTADGVTLAGTLFTPAHPVAAPPVAIFSATGLTQRLYAPFALWLANHGRTVLTMDYRGIGATQGDRPLRGSLVRKQDWGELDMPATAEWLLKETNAGQLDVIGHSSGGQLVGLMPNHRLIRRLVAVSGSSGYLGNLGWRMALSGHFLFRVFTPLSNALLGYAAYSKVKFGDDLPAHVARQWALWCSSPGYVANGFGNSIERHYYDEFAAPITVIHAIDDTIAVRANVEDWLRLMPRAPKEIVTLTPAMVGGKPINHAGMFRRSHEALWPIMAQAIMA